MLQALLRSCTGGCRVSRAGQGNRWLEEGRLNVTRAWRAVNCHAGWARGARCISTSAWRRDAPTAPDRPGDATGSRAQRDAGDADLDLGLIPEKSAKAGLEVIRAWGVWRLASTSIPASAAAAATQ